MYCNEKFITVAPEVSAKRKRVETHKTISILILLSTY